MPAVNENFLFCLPSDSDRGFVGFILHSCLGRCAGLEEETTLSKTRFSEELTYYYETSLNCSHYVNILFLLIVLRVHFIICGYQKTH